MCWAGLPTECPTKHKSLREIPVIFSLDVRYQVNSNGYTYVKITQSEREALLTKAKNKEAYIWQGGFTRFSGEGAPETILICTNCGYVYDDKSGEWLKISDNPEDFAVPLLDPIKQLEVVMKDSRKKHVKYIQSFFQEYRHDKMEYQSDKPSAEVISYFKTKIPSLGVSGVKSPPYDRGVAGFMWIIGKWKQYYIEVIVGRDSSVKVELSSENGLYDAEFVAPETPRPDPPSSK